MSAATLSPTARQPFGAVSGARLRNLTNLKNKQNAIPTTPSGSVKRLAPAEFDDVDTENVDPIQFFSPSNKKAKNFEFDTSKLTKAPLFSLTPSNTPAKRATVPQATGYKRKVSDNLSIHELRHREPSSAPTAAAGRSPKHKRIGILSKRRATSSPFTRIDPPAFNTATGGLPFSIDAALHGTVPSVKPKSKVSKKASWAFEIHEDHPDDEMANLMEHSTCTLEISDDEGRSSPKGDRDNKENIAPADYQAGTNMPATRRDMMTDDARSPLGDLVAKDFYADGCDASSVIIIPAEDAVEANEKVVLPAAGEPSTPTRSLANAVTEGRQGWESLLAQVAAKAGASNAGLEPGDKENAAEIQIWESGSAKAEDEETDVEDHVVAQQHSLVA